MPNYPMLMYGLLFTLITWVKNTRLGEKWRGHPRRGYLLTEVGTYSSSRLPTIAPRIDISLGAAQCSSRHSRHCTCVNCQHCLVVKEFLLVVYSTPALK